MSAAESGRSPPARGERVYFDAVLLPFRSLSRPGFALLMVSVAAAGGVIVLTFLLAGASPVTGFFRL